MALLGVPWAQPYIVKIWRKGERDAKHEPGHGAGPDHSDAIIALAGVEIAGILSATVQQAGTSASSSTSRQPHAPGSMRSRASSPGCPGAA